jgi:BirA family biotin operon repressor/biotin-[acetyl-CoA-carboxylase] ligase
MLSSDKIKAALHTDWAGREVIYKEVTGSTNTDAAALAKENAAHGTLVVADKQESGKGSHGRGWETPAGSNIAMSMVLRPTAPMEAISMITLVAGLSVAEAIDRCLTESRETIDRSFTDSGEAVSPDATSDDRPGVVSRIKWPNDVVIRGRKICGILTEMHPDPAGGIADVILGIGINVNMVDFPQEIRDFAGSVFTQTGVKLDRNLLVARCLERFEENYDKYDKTHDLSLLKEQYERRLVNMGEKVLLLDSARASVVAGQQAVEQSFKGDDREIGTALGITDRGELIVEMDSGEVREVGAGEVSVRGIYGYV